jgi:hypothetical protein
MMMMMMIRKEADNQRETRKKRDKRESRQWRVNEMMSILITCSFLVPHLLGGGKGKGKRDRKKNLVQRRAGVS